MSINVMDIFSKRLPMVQQTSMAECGLACLSMISGYHDRPLDITSIRLRYATSLRGMNLYDIKEVADKLGFATRAIRVSCNMIGHIALPAILHWNNNHFVVLKQVKKNHIVIHDPAWGRVDIPLDQIEQHFSGIAIELSPVQDFVVEKEAKKYNAFDLFKGFVGIRRQLFRVAILTLAIEVFSNLSPLYMQVIVDDALVSADNSLLLVLFIGYLIISGLHVITSLIRSWLILRIGTLLNGFIQTKVFSKLVNLPVVYFEQRHVGDVVSRFHSLHTIQSTLTTNFIEAIVDGILAIFVVFIMFMYSSYLSFVCMFFIAVQACLRFVRYYPFKQYLKESIISQAKLDTHFLETIRGIRSVKLFNRQITRRDQWLALLYDCYNKDIRLKYLNINFAEVQSFINFVEKGTAIFLGANAVMTGQMTVGFLLAFLAYKDQFVWRLDGLIQKAFDFAMIGLHVERLADIVGSESEKESAESYLLLGDLKPAIEIKNLSFRYSMYEPFVLQNFNLTISPGEHVVITGRSGTGKSTIVKLLLGILEPVDGFIMIDGVSIAKLGSTELRRIAGNVMQDDELFSGTVLENITFFDNNPDIEWAEHCARVAEIHDDIVNMKMAYNTIIGGMASSLSGGQKQRILIARAIYVRPKILIMDEATSSVDVEIEKKIAANIASLEITRISISHRTQTIQSADRQICI
jgi:ATP-binding cassette, subfamily B, bacterial CvaB/MchF/RaxB